MLEDVLQKGLQSSIVLKSNLELLTTSPRNGRAIASTLLQPDIWDTLIRTYTNNVMAQNLILEALERDGMSGNPEALQNVKDMIRGAKELIERTRKMNENAPKLRAEREPKESTSEPLKQQHHTPAAIPTGPSQALPLQQSHSISTSSKHISPTVESVPDEGPTIPEPFFKAEEPSGLYFFDTSPDTAVHTTVRVPNVPTRGWQDGTPEDGSPPKGARRWGKSRSQNPGYLAGPRIKEPRLEDFRSKEADNLYRKRKSDISMQDADEADADVSMLSNGIKRIRTTPPKADHLGPPAVEYEDISAEVDAQLNARQERKEREKKKDLGMLVTPKRKRQSGESVEDIGVAVRTGIVDSGGARKRQMKKLKQGHGRSEGDASTPAAGTPFKESIATNEKRRAIDDTVFEGLNKREKKKLKKEVKANTESGWGV